MNAYIPAFHPGRVSLRGVARRLKQLERAIAEQVEVVLDASPLEPVALEIGGDVSVCLRLVSGAGCFELARVYDHRR
jgi:hypothetical protein